MSEFAAGRPPRARLFVVGRWRGKTVASKDGSGGAGDRLELLAWDLLGVASSAELADKTCARPVDFYVEVEVDDMRPELGPTSFVPVRWPRRAPAEPASEPTPAPEAP